MWRIVKHQDINIQQWDDMIGTSTCPRIEATYNYLSILGRWDAMIYNDYQAGIPLPYNHKWLGIRQIYQPLFCQQLGFFSIVNDFDIFDQALSLMAKSFKLIHIQSNSAVLLQHPLFRIKERGNLILPLNQSYMQLAKGYAKGVKSNVKDHQIEKFDFLLNDDIDQFLNFVQLYTNKDDPSDKPQNIEILRKLAGYLIQEGHGSIVEVRKGQHTFAYMMFSIYKNRITTLVARTSPEGRRLRAMIMLIDFLIRKYAESDYVLDFEGSEIAGVRDFYLSFGANEENYQSLHLNQLPFPLRQIHHFRYPQFS